MKAWTNKIGLLGAGTWALLTACQDLSLADTIEETAGGTTSGRDSVTGGTPSSGGAGASSGGIVTLGGNSSTGGLTTTGTGGQSMPIHSGQGGNTEGAHSSQAASGTNHGGEITTGGSNSGGGSATSGMGSGGVTATGGMGSGGVTATGGMGSGGVTATGGMGSGGVIPIGGTSTIVTVASGDTSTGGVTATGGLSSGGVLSIGGTSTIFPLNSGGTTNAPDAGSENPDGSADQGPNACPNPISKSKALRAAEPKPVDPCARVSSVISQSSSYYAFGYTNGEIYVVNVSTPDSATRVDTWNPIGTWMSLPRALITALYAPPNNNEGTLLVGYADPSGTLKNPWYAAMVGRGWFAGTADDAGTVLTLSGCPFHSSPSHLAMSMPWTTEESAGSMSVFSKANAGTISEHLHISGGGGVTAVETSRSDTSWQVYVGTVGGELYKSNELTGSIVWDDATSSLSIPVSWSRITGPGMPKSWVTRIAIHPTQPQRLFAVFASRSTDALWYSEDGGQTWSNRFNGLPTASNPPEAPPIVGASFNPFLDGAAYVVTPQTSYFTENSGVTWREW